MVSQGPDQPPHEAFDPADEVAAAEDTTESTGHPVVDEVIASLRQLETAPPSERVAIFEDAHRKLREALADAADEAPRE